MISLHSVVFVRMEVSFSLVLVSVIESEVLILSIQNTKLTLTSSKPLLPTLTIQLVMGTLRECITVSSVHIMCVIV